jgi:hypothetical protein
MQRTCEGCGTDEKISSYKLDRLTAISVCPVCLRVLTDTYKHSAEMTSEQRVAAVRNSNVVSIRRRRARREMTQRICQRQDFAVGTFFGRWNRHRRLDFGPARTQPNWHIPCHIPCVSGIIAIFEGEFHHD